MWLPGNSKFHMWSALCFMARSGLAFKDCLCLWLKRGRAWRPHHMRTVWMFLMTASFPLHELYAPALPHCPMCLRQPSSTDPPGHSFILQSTLQLPPHTAPSIVTVFTSEVLNLSVYTIHCHAFICRPHLPLGLQSFGHEGPYLSYTLSHWYLVDPQNIKIHEMGRKMKFLLYYIEKISSNWNVC